ncbi:MAG TPA: hypothetical protein VFR68_08140 [Candidatus Dormibacteraeota bacterium]|nr:hypothetical protein [Candidatus Dormibacteraeota bacterium]
MKYRLPFALLALTFSLALSACGLNVGAAKPTPTPDPEKAMLAFTQCMRAHGVDMPDPGANGAVSIGGGPGNPVDQATMEAAQNACRSKLPKGGHQPSAAEQKQFQDQAIKFAQCMRAHGVDMPDPTFSNSGGGALVQQSIGNGVDPTSAQFQAAQKTCQSLMPGRPGSGTVTSGSGGFGSTGGAH